MRLADAAYDFRRFAAFIAPLNSPRAILNKSVLLAESGKEGKGREGRTEEDEVFVKRATR